MPWQLVDDMIDEQRSQCVALVDCPVRTQYGWRVSCHGVGRSAERFGVRSRLDVLAVIVLCMSAVGKNRAIGLAKKVGVVW
jgi:hypothetical protein